MCLPLKPRAYTITSSVNTDKFPLPHFQGLYNGESDKLFLKSAEKPDFTPENTDVFVPQPVHLGAALYPLEDINVCAMHI